MGEIIALAEYVSGENILRALFIVTAYITMIVLFINLLIKVFMKLYHTKRGIDTKDETIEKDIKKLQSDVYALQEIHREDIKKIYCETEITNKELRETIQQLKASMDREYDRTSKMNQAILRNEIIRAFKEMKQNDDTITPTDKENLDKLFENYFECGGNGLIKGIKTEYDKIIKVDYDSL
ncbi:MAG: hypothetical protein PHC62_00330 [Candidatus Izemoplasmatales bacterium]|nr:hypothetical protein [Candidatus Izemoplasmatales bacterium]